MKDANVAEKGVNLFTSSRSSIPAAIIASGEAVLTIIETSGSSPERTQNRVTIPGYIRPAAQFMARARQYPVARAMAQAAYDEVVGIRNCYIVSENGLESGWYREIVPLQEPFDAGVGDDGLARCGFNVVAVRRPD